MTKLSDLIIQVGKECNAHESVAYQQLFELYCEGKGEDFHRSFLDGITELVCAYYDVNRDVIISSSKDRRVSHARHMVMYVAVQKVPHSYIAHYFGCHLSACYYAEKKIKDYLSYDKQTQRDVEKITKPVL